MSETHSTPTMWAPFTIAKLVHITPVSLWFVVFIDNLLEGLPGYPLVMTNSFLLKMAQSKVREFAQ